MNAKECAIEYMLSRYTRDPVTLFDLAEGNGLTRKEIAIEYRRLLKNEKRV